MTITFCLWDYNFSVYLKVRKNFFPFNLIWVYRPFPAGLEEGYRTLCILFKADVSFLQSFNS